MDSNNLDGIVFTLPNLFLGKGKGKNINLANFANYNNFITIVNFFLITSMPSEICSSIF